MDKQNFQDGSPGEIRMGENPNEKVTDNESQMDSSIINVEEDCGCVAEEVTHSYSKNCSFIVSTSCVDGMETTVEQTCCQRGDCASDCLHYPGKSCEQVCKEFNIPYKPRK